MAAATLKQAGDECYAHMAAHWAAGNLPARFTAFNNDILTIFPDDGTQTNRTVSNWLVIGRKVQAVIAQAVTIPSDVLNDAAQYVYRLCYDADNAVNGTPVRITSAQGTAILAAYNAHLD